MNEQMISSPTFCLEEDIRNENYQTENSVKSEGGKWYQEVGELKAKEKFPSGIVGAHNQLFSRKVPHTILSSK